MPLHIREKRRLLGGREYRHSNRPASCSRSRGRRAQASGLTGRTAELKNNERAHK